MLVAREGSGTQKDEEQDQGEEIAGHGKSILRKQMDIIHRVSHRGLTKGHVPVGSGRNGAKAGSDGGVLFGAREEEVG